MNGRASSMATKIARIFGTKTSVISWICVSAWNSEIATPTTRPISISGLETITSVTMASRATSITSGPVIRVPFLAVGFPRRSDLHAHDFFIRLDDLVAHRDHGADRHFGFRHGRDDVDDIGLAGHERLRLRVGFMAGLDYAADGVLQHFAETLPARGGLGEAA